MLRELHKAGEVGAELLLGPHGRYRKSAGNGGVQLAFISTSRSRDAILVPSDLVWIAPPRTSVSVTSSMFS